MESIDILSLKQLFRNTNAFWAFVIFLMLFLPGFAEDKSQIGQIIASVGKVKAITSDQTERSLKRGDPFYALEVIVVEAASKAQLKFIDGGIINLISQTEFRVDSYVFNEPNRVSEFLSTLIKGGFRAASGAITKVNPAGTKVRTPLATLGLRGTIFEAIFLNGKVSAGCEEGKIAVANDKGEVEIGPTSNTLYAIVIEGEPPLPSIKKPSDLASVSFEIEGGEPFGVQPGSAPAVISPPAQPQTFSLPEPKETYAPQMNYPQEFPQYGPSGREGGQTRTGQEVQQGREKSYPGYERSYQISGKNYDTRSQDSKGSGKTYQSSGQYDQGSRDYQSSRKSYPGKKQYGKSDDNYDYDRSQKYPGDNQRVQRRDPQEIDRGYPGGGFPISPF